MDVSFSEVKLFSPYILPLQLYILVKETLASVLTRQPVGVWIATKRPLLTVCRFLRWTHVSLLYTEGANSGNMAKSTWCLLQTTSEVQQLCPISTG